MYNILTLNKISNVIYDILKGYNIGAEIDNPNGIIVRSAKMHDYTVGDNLVAVARAGAGVNNIPVDEMSKRGIVVFNTPGANANAVKELAICSLLMASRDIFEGANWANTLSCEDVDKQVEKGKADFGGCEILGKTLGLLGLGAIGALVADAAISLGMKVVGYDPYISAENKAALNANVKIVDCAEKVFAQSDYISLHAPLLEGTKNMINAQSIAKMKDGVKIINMSRGGLVNTADVIAAIKEGKVKKYVTDFPGSEEICQKGIIPIPHLGASTEEAEENCAIMAAHQIKDYLESGNIVNSVNFPKISAPKGKCRLQIIAQKCDAFSADLKAIFGQEKISAAANKEYAVALIDADNIGQDKIEQAGKLPGVLRVRLIK
ncbi:MAG: 3-phosphoglycerate dehydrogenase [Christensenellales bacterium]|jgi:D-3-phosphoglycerate dehydrogenase